jgi:cobaltochelatase CobS
MTTQTQANVQPISQSAVDYNERVQVDAHQCFPELFAPNQFQVQMRKHRHPDCKKSNPDFLPDLELFKKVMVWWHIPMCPMPLGLVGETGTGKTEFLLYIADRLNEPVYIEKISSGMRGEALEGGYELVTNEHGHQITQKRYAQASIGYKHGGLVLFDEVDKANEDVATALHLFLEGKPWTLSAFGETVNRHALTRIVCTANTTGQGGSERYITSNQLDAAVRNRIGWHNVQYPDKFAEMKILKKKFPQMPDTLAQEMLRLGNALRDALLGPKRDGNIDNPIASPFSTRNLVNWGLFIIAYGFTRPLRESFNFAYGNNVNEEDRQVVEDAIKGIFANDGFDMPLGDYLNGKK